ncbi:MAG: cyclase family protein [Acidobacteria bacterium]|nr:cyclase family protein [Acidobacteriota bacterium]
MAWIDISTPIASAMLVWPGDDPVSVHQTMSIEAGDDYNLTRLAMSAHTGTHMDAPRHFLRNGTGMETMPLSLMAGPALVIDVDDPRAVRARHIPSGLPPAARILFRTRNSTHHLLRPEFVEDFVFIGRDAADALATAGAALVGIDYLSVGGFRQDLRETHEILLGAGIWIVEGLRLAHVLPGSYELLCLPLLIPGADGAPARALLRPTP